MKNPLNIRIENYRLADNQRAIKGLALMVEAYNRGKSQLNFKDRSDSDLLQESQAVMECVSQTLFSIASSVDATREAIYAKASEINDKLNGKSENTK